MPSQMFFASTNGEDPPRKTPFQGNLCQERIAYPAIPDQVFLVWECEGWSVFDRPQTMPTSTRDEWSGSGQPPIEDTLLWRPRSGEKRVCGSRPLEKPPPRGLRH